MLQSLVLKIIMIHFSIEFISILFRNLPSYKKKIQQKRRSWIDYEPSKEIFNKHLIKCFLSPSSNFGQKSPTHAPPLSQFLWYEMVAMQTYPLFGPLKKRTCIYVIFFLIYLMIEIDSQPSNGWNLMGVWHIIRYHRFVEREIQLLLIKS